MSQSQHDLQFSPRQWFLKHSLGGTLNEFKCLSTTTKDQVWKDLDIGSIEKLLKGVDQKEFEFISDRYSKRYRCTCDIFDRVKKERFAAMHPENEEVQRQKRVEVLQNQIDYLESRFAKLNHSKSEQNSFDEDLLKTQLRSQGEHIEMLQNQMRHLEERLVDLARENENLRVNSH
jgi:uncharacterized coiled-coil protein SlyX